MTESNTPAPRKMHTTSYYTLRNNYAGREVGATVTNGTGRITIGLRPASPDYEGTTASMSPDEARAIAADLIARADEIDAHHADVARAAGMTPAELAHAVSFIGEPTGEAPEPAASALAKVKADAWSEGDQARRASLVKWYEPTSIEQMYWPDPANPYRVEADRIEKEATPTD